MATPKNVQVGDRVRWMSRDGWKRGEVLQIFNTQDKWGDYINFFQIEYSDGFNGTGVAMICDNELEEIQFTVRFRDWELQAEQAEYERFIDECCLRAS